MRLTNARSAIRSSTCSNLIEYTNANVVSNLYAHLVVTSEDCLLTKRLNKSEDESVSTAKKTFNS